MQPPATAPNARRPAFVFEVLAAATVYFATARLGLELAVVARPVSIIWPATGLALALLILRGRRLWPAVLLGAFASNALNETSIFTSAGIAIGNTLEALVGATLLQRVGFLPSMRRLHDVASLFLLAACLSTMVSATIGVITVCLGGTTSWHDFTSLWSTWWIGDAIGNLVTAPFVFVWADQARNRWRLQRLAEGMLLLFSMGFLSLAVFVDHGSEVPYPVHYLIFPAVIWAALRLGQHATATLVFGSLAVTIVATIAGRGPFVTTNLGASLLQVALFMAVVAVTGLFLGAATAERNRAERRRSEDYARLRSSEERLARQAEELAAADRRKDEFLAVLGHELRNPLAPLQNGLELLALGANDQALVTHSRQLMERQLRHLVRLVDDLLDVARIRSGKIVLELERVELAPMITSAVELARPLIDSRNHELHVVLPPAPLWTDADKIRLPQLLANLLNNSAKYTDEGGSITLSVAQLESQIVVNVRDTGIGMDAESLANVFELFAQAAGPAHAVQGGLGVGLSLARSIAELHGGVLTAHSEGLGKGSQFILELPAAQAPAIRADATLHPGEPGMRQRILVVDDNVDAAESLGTMLAYSGHDVRVAHGGVEALSTAHEFAPNVMILDLGMPEMDGYAVARAVRSDPKFATTRLIALSGYGQADDRRRTADVGFDEHLVKPVEHDVLNAALN
ncbi:MAG TPA: MASE1 domain-containing protein [Steroidobacteraceae bacterium]|nr:MASE1 domain-containing protein [Steroidobacteraceae bacterium]